MRPLRGAERYGRRLALLAIALVVVAVPFATLAFNVMAEGPLIAWDGSIADALNRWVDQNRGALVVIEIVSWAGRPPILAIVVGAAAVWCWRQARYRLAVFLVATTGSGALLGTLIKVVVDRPRPEVDHPVATAFGKSFPSGHAMHATITYGALLLVALPMVDPRVRRGLVAAVVVVVAAIGSSRLLLGVHFLTDVIGGFLLGGAWLAAAASAFETWNDGLRSGRGHDQTTDRELVSWND